ncbi:MAG TPA: chemotaxis-specific protein-glutamate methyltransferase CheB [Geobacteraceae bacterium]
MIRILLADDSPLTRAVIGDAFAAVPDLMVVGEASNGREAVVLTEKLRPDIVIMDIMMPVMDGLQATEEIMARCPTPILVISATLDDTDVNLAFTAIKKGALDVMGKPGGREEDRLAEFHARLVEKVRLLARIKVIGHRLAGRRRPAPVPRPATDGRDLLAIGASTGGPKAVMSIIRTLPAGFNAAVFVVQHISAGFARGFAQWLDQECALPVRLAAAGDLPRPGEVLVAPNEYHMLLENGRISLNQEPPVNCCRPSIDVFFQSLAGEAGRRVVGVLLTGMGRDGAAGLRKVREHGGLTIVQDEKSCAVFGMPKAAISLDAADHVLPLTEIPQALTNIFTP